MNKQMQEEAARFGDAVANYLKPWKHELNSYAWPMSADVKRAIKELGLSLQDTNGGVAATHALRVEVANRARLLHILRGNEREAKLESLCSFVIKDWGALRANKNETIANYVRTYTSRHISDLSGITSLDHLHEQSGCNFRFKGISSWSKWLNFIWHEWALIYDARIAFALNAIHILRGVNAHAFPVPQGRDRFLSTMDTQTLAALGYLKCLRAPIPDGGAGIAQLARWLESGTVQEDSAYEYYLLVMQRVRDVLGREGPHSLVETEMLLYYLSNRRVVHDLLRSLSNLLPATKSPKH